jgi:hypothetical protein
VCAGYSWDRVADATVSVYREALAGSLPATPAGPAGPAGPAATFAATPATASHRRER